MRFTNNRRFELNANLNKLNPVTFYGRGDDENPPVGYTDYPFLESSQQRRFSYGGASQTRTTSMNIN